MGRSSGAGSPISFKCPACRGRGVHTMGVKLTGKQKPHRSPPGSALGSRSSRVSRQYACRCGHVGWSCHVDLARRADA